MFFFYVLVPKHTMYSFSSHLQKVFRFSDGFLNKTDYILELNWSYWSVNNNCYLILRINATSRVRTHKYMYKADVSIYMYEFR